MIKIKNIYLAKNYIDKLKPFNGGYATGIIYELENGEFYQAQSTDVLSQFRKLDNKEVKTIFSQPNTKEDK